MLQLSVRCVAGRSWRIVRSWFVINTSIFVVDVLSVVLVLISQNVVGDGSVVLSTRVVYQVCFVCLFLLLLLFFRLNEMWRFNSKALLALTQLQRDQYREAVYDIFINYYCSKTNNHQNIVCLFVVSNDACQYGAVAMLRADLLLHNDCRYTLIFFNFFYFSEKSKLISNFILVLGCCWSFSETSASNLTHICFSDFSSHIIIKLIFE